jgi:hypothetical protein
MPTRLPRERESKVLRSIRIRLRHRFGIRLYRRSIGGRREGDRYIPFGRAGEADLYGFMPRSHQNRHIELEVKRPGNKPTLKQIAWLREMHALGCIAMWCDNANDAERCFEAIMRGARVVWDDRDFWLEMSS